MRSTLVMAALALAAPAFSQDTGTLKARIVFGGGVIEPAKITPNTDVAFCGQHELFNERLLVNAENKGIRNTVLYVHTGRGGSTLPPQEPPQATHELANENCRFEPRVVALQAGDTLKVTNPDEVTHNANISFFANGAMNVTVAPKGEKAVLVEKPEPAVIPVECNIHPWMKGFVVVLDHPFVGISDENGEIEISDLPPGKLVFRLWNEAATGAIRQITIGDEEVSLRRNALELEIKPGMNDLGTITIAADALQP